MFMNNERMQKLRLALGFLVFVASGICYSLHAPLFPTQALHKGSTRMWVGGITGSFDIVGVLTAFTPIFFNLRNVKFCFIVGVLIGGSGTVLFGLTSFIENETCYNLACLALRSVMGAGCFLTWVCGLPLMTSLLFSHHSAAITTAVETSDAFGNIIGPVIGSSLFYLGGFFLPYLVTGLFLINLGVVCILVLDTSRRMSCTTPLITPKSSVFAFFERSDNPSELILTESSSMSFGDFVSKPKIILSTLPYFAVCSLQGYLAVSLTPYLEIFEIRDEKSGFCFLIFTTSAAITCLLVGKLTEKGYGAFLYLVAPSVSSLCMALLFIPVISESLQNLQYTLPFLAVFGMCYATSAVTILLVCERVAIIHDFTDIDQLNLYVATLWNLIFSCGRIFGSIVLGGFVLSNLGFYWTNFVTSMILLAATVIGRIALFEIGLMDRIFNFHQIFI